MVECDDRAPVTTFFSGAPFAVGAMATLGEGPAHHARVKRLAAGDVVRLTDGHGRVGIGAVSVIRRSGLDVAVERVDVMDRPGRIDLCVPIGDRERMLWIAEKATELGVATWQAVRFRRSGSVSSRGEGPAFAAKVRSRMINALEQSGGGWLPEVLTDTTLAGLTAVTGALTILLATDGMPLLSLLGGLHASATVLFGPEGGLEPSESEALETSGWLRARLATTTLRFETAGIAAIAVLRASHLLTET